MLLSRPTVEGREGDVEPTAFPFLPLILHHGPKALKHGSWTNVCFNTYPDRTY